MIKVGDIISCCEKGPRKNNEDALLIHTTQAPYYFVVCDGVGGSACGELASSSVCEAFSTFLEENKDKVLSEFLFEDAYKYASRYLLKLSMNNDRCGGMSTTLVFAVLDKQGVWVGWCGDSRLYHLRNNRVLYQTFDHSFVNTLVKKGILSPERAEIDPRKNIIERAVSEQYEPKSLEVHLIRDIEPGDYLFLASDGAYDALKSNLCETIFDTSLLPENKKDEMIRQCEEKAVDNYTFILVELIDD